MRGLIQIDKNTKLLHYRIMSTKTLTILIVLFILINAGLFIFLNKDSFTKKTTTNLPYNYQPLSSETNVSLPVALDKQGVSSAVLIYTFSGKLTKVEPVGSSYRWTLDISDNSLPEFLVNDNTTIVRSRDENLTKVDLSSIKIGANVTIGMTYDLRTKTWSLNTVTIAP